MKTTSFKLIVLPLLILLFTSCKDRKDYKILGNVPGIKDSTIIDLYIIHENLGIRIATDTIIDGKFTFSDSIGSEKLTMSLRIRDREQFSGRCNIWVANTDIHISGNSKYLSQWLVSSKLEEQKQENNLLKHIRKYKVEIDSMLLLEASVDRESQEAKAIQNKMDSINKVLYAKELDYFKDNYNSLIAVKELCNIAQFGDSIQKGVIKSFYHKIDTVYSNTLWGEGINSYLNKVVPPKVGDHFVNTTAFDVKGKQHSLSDYQGKYMLLDFWSAGCYPCILAAPELRQLAAKYKDKLNIVGLNMDTQSKFWVETSEKDSITWINLSDGKGTFGGASYKYGIDGFPTYILINPQGIIVDRWMGFQEGIFEEKLVAFLEK
jgi:thiol-disulfide isomerase/thioredoxin